MSLSLLMVASWENNLSGSCANNFGNGPNRWLSVGSNNQVEPAYQFGSCNVVVFYGCTDPLANNYNSNATNDDGSCDYTVFGCTDPSANNYDPLATTDDGSCTYTVSVEFNVDMNNEVVSSQGVHIAGTFTSWSTDSIEMFDLDGDGIYTVSVDLNQGWYYEYKYLNGDNSSAYEVLASWESCINGGNRVLNTDTSSTQVLSVVCFSSCSTCPVYGCTDPTATNYDPTATVDDGSCIYPSSGCMDPLANNYDPLATTDDGSCTYTVSVEFNVDMNNEVVSSQGVHIAGTFTSWSTDSIEMFDLDGDGIYTVSVDLNQGWYYEYKYLNGDNSSAYEVLASWESCINGGNRVLNTDTSSTQVLSVVCFSSCSTCPVYGCTDPTATNYDPTATVDDGSCIFPSSGCMDPLANNYDPLATTDDGSCIYTVSVEFNVDMNNEVVSSQGVHIAGTFTSWSTDSIEMFDLDGDGIYTVSVDLNQGWYYEYKYLNGNNWATDEILAIWESCSNGGGNRVLNTDTSSTQVLSVVCFSSCSTCPVYGCTDPTATNYDPTATVDDGSCIYFVYGCMDITSCNYNPLATIDDGSCYNLTVDLGNDTSLCSFAGMVLTVYGNYSSYEWNTLDTSSQIIISSSGIYSILVSDSLGCIASDTIVISLSNPPLVDIGNDQKLCLGDSLILDAGSDWNNYLWSDSTTLQTFVVDTFGLYYVTVTDSLGCQGSDYVNITMDTASVAGFTYTINGLTVDFIDTSSHATSYLWDFMSDGTFLDTSNGDVSFTYQNPGFFDVTLLVSNSCGTDTFTSTIDLISSDIKNINSNFQVYPNPSKNQICH